MISYQGKRRGAREKDISYPGKGKEEKRKDVKATPVTTTIHFPFFIDFLFQQALEEWSFPLLDII